MTLIDQFLDACDEFMKKANIDDFRMQVIVFKHLSIPNDLTTQFINTEVILDSWISRGLPESVLIPGLIRAIDTTFTSKALSYEATRKDWQQDLDFIDALLASPELRQRVSDDMKAELGYSKRTVEQLKQWRDETQKQLDNPDDNQAERNRTVEIWREVTQPILEQDNLAEAINANSKSRFSDQDE